MKKKNWYLFVIFIGFILVITGIFTLSEAVSSKNTSRIWIRVLMMIFWIAFTISNIFLYKKEIGKSKE